MQSVEGGETAEERFQGTNISEERRGEMQITGYETEDAKG